MKIFVTGSNGFVGKNLVHTLKNIADKKDRSFDIDTDITVLEYDIGLNEEYFDEYCKQTDFVVNLAGVNRPKEQSEFITGNSSFVEDLTNTLKKHGNKCPVLLSSSIQAELDNPYGISKRQGEQILFSYGEETGAAVYVYRFMNIFGKWCRPNYNSVIATFCNNIASGLPITVNDKDAKLKLVYIDDVVKEIINAIKGKAHFNKESGFCEVPVFYETTVGEVSDLIYSFKKSREDKSVPDCDKPFIHKLYSTYISYLSESEFSYPLIMNTDERGSFTEILKTPDRGQVSVNISKPGITKGNHWHHTKNEKFCVVSGEGVIRFRKIGEERVIEYRVNGKELKVVDIPVGYTHSIINEGDSEMITIMWASELFNSNKPDTYFEEV
ncbi:MAG TPA: NAD-dependent epimerase/dehydratase family protein [Oscillospiraceae bacterium]|nr:NAD-dependent epimerase/dehydratase family protein [Oscillospiraceae bacterium]